MHVGLWLTFIAGVLLTLGDLTFRVWTDNTRVWKWYILGIVVYFISLNLLAQSYRFKNIAIASLIMEIVNLATFLGLSYWKFGDRFSHLEILGIVFGVLAIICFEVG